MNNNLLIFTTFPIRTAGVNPFTPLATVFRNWLCKSTNSCLSESVNATMLAPVGHVDFNVWREFKINNMNFFQNYKKCAYISVVTTDVIGPTAKTTVIFTSTCTCCSSLTSCTSSGWTKIIIIKKNFKLFYEHIENSSEKNSLKDSYAALSLKITNKIMKNVTCCCCCCCNCVSSTWVSATSN